MNTPRTRSVPFTLTRAADGGDGLTLEGYAAVFDQATRINDPWDGDYEEVFQRGSFAKTIKERTPYLMLQHGRHPLVGPLPIGNIESLSEDKNGLHVVARLHDNWLVQPVRDAIASGSISGMSIMFEPMKETRDESGDVPVITRTEVKLHELGPVVFPTFEGTTVGVRSLSDLNNLERILTTQSVQPEVTSDEAAPEGTSDGEADTDDERSSPPEVLAALARNRASRYPQGLK